MSGSDMNRISLLRHARADKPDAPFDEIVPACDPESQASLVELACIDLIDRLRAGRTVRVEEYVSSIPALQDDEVVLDLIDAELCVRQEMGKPPDRKELVTRFPSLESAIDRMFFLDDLEERIQAKPSLPPLPKVDGFRLRKQLAKDSISATYQAVRGNGDRCLLRLFNPESRDDVSLLNAIKAAGDNKEPHPGLLQIDHIGATEDRLFYSVPFTDGATLRSLTTKPIAVKQAAEWLRGLAIVFAFYESQAISLGRVSADQILIDHHNSPRVMGFGAPAADPHEVVQSFGELGQQMVVPTSVQSTTPANVEDPFWQICNQCLSAGQPSGYCDVNAIIDPLTAYLSGRSIAPHKDSGFFSKLFRRK